jgi:hypothetical protein
LAGVDGDECDEGCVFCGMQKLFVNLFFDDEPLG